MELILSVIGFILLFGGGEILLRSTIQISNYYNIPRFFVGVVIIGFGTSMPEMFASIMAVYKDAENIALGNIIGSNISNIMLIIPIAALIKPIILNCYSNKKDSHEKTNIKFDIYVMLSFTFYMVCFTLYGNINFLYGITILFMLFSYIILSYKNYQKSFNKTSHNSDAENLANNKDHIKRYCHNIILNKFISKYYKYFLFLFVFIGIYMLIYGSSLIVDSAIYIARYFDISEIVIGATMIAIGTSLPELATGILLSVRGNNDILIGEIIGSNIFNLSAILGVTSMISPIKVPDIVINFDVWILAIISIIFAVIILKCKFLNRLLAFSFLLLYSTYIVYLIY